jgi:hypothetical protein
MFLRVVRAPSGKTGVKHEYVRVVEACRDHEGKTRHQTIINLGRRDLLTTHLDLDKLSRLLHGDQPAKPSAEGEDVGAIGAWDWGAMLVAAHLWRELGLERIIDTLSAPDRRDAAPLSDRALVLVTNRLVAASMRWRSGWRATLSVTAAAGDSCLLGAKTLNAKPVECRGSALRCVNCSNGTARSINCWRVRRRLSWSCLYTCAICFRCRSIWCFTNRRHDAVSRYVIDNRTFVAEYHVILGGLF